MLIAAHADCHPYGTPWPRISIVTPSYNQGRFIEQTIRSVLMQGYPNLDYLLVDGGSVDETKTILEKYEHCFTYWVSEPDRGQSHAINKGLARCTGEIFNWINSDDYYEPKAFQIIAAQFSEHPELQVLCCKTRMLDEVTGEVKYSSGRKILNGLERTLFKMGIDQPATFFKRQVVDELGGVPEDFHYVMDKVLWLNYLLRFGLARVRRLDAVVVNFRYHSSSKSTMHQASFMTEEQQLKLALAKTLDFPDWIVKGYAEAWQAEVPGLELTRPAVPLNVSFLKYLYCRNIGRRNFDRKRYGRSLMFLGFGAGYWILSLLGSRAFPDCRGA